MTKELREIPEALFHLLLYAIAAKGLAGFC